MGDKIYSIQVLETGYDDAFPTAIAFDGWLMADKLAYSPFSVTLIRGAGHNILFDCGIDPFLPDSKRHIEMENDKNCRNPKVVLAGTGLTPEDIDILVVSHLHWDHVSGIGFYPNARVYLQHGELRGWKDAFANPRFPDTHRGVVDPGIFDVVDKIDAEGRLVLLDGDAQLLPGINVKSAKGHSFAQSMLFMDNGACGRYAVIGDVAMRPESFTGGGAFSCPLPNLKFCVGTIMDIIDSYYDILEWVGGDVNRIVMCHDGTHRDKWATRKSGAGLDISDVC